MMKTENWTSVTEFILLGLTENTNLHIPLFVLFLIFYIITVLGNISIMALISVSPRLHTPMYFLLSNLAFVDICYATIISPNMLANFLSKSKSISVPSCITQLFFFILVGSTEVFLLLAMAYDRYVAICNPLLYNVVMTKKACVYLSSLAYSIAFLNSVIHTSCMLKLNFCGPNKIMHFYCDIPPLLKLSCSDTSLNEEVVFFVIGSFLIASFILILISYTCIVLAILKIRSADGRSRAFSTCSSHLFCVILFFATVFFMYLRPSSSYSLDQDRVASVVYTVIIPMLNPLIYSLRNQEVKGALQQTKWRKCT